MKEQRYKARRDEHLGMERKLHSEMSHRDHLAQEHERHAQRMEHEKAMHDHMGRHHKRG